MSFLDEYQPVEDRLRLFWEDHPYGRVITELLHHQDGDYIVLASVYFGNELRNDPPTATGLAHDSTSSLPANMKSSALEVCETSAIGRALANAGYAPKDKRPSREEMAKAAAPPASGGSRRPAEGALPPVDRAAAITSDVDGDGEAPTASGETSERAGAGEQLGGVAHPASASEPTHVHEWAKAPREGWAVCECGKAEKLTKVTIHTAPIEERTDLK